jgi:hypothetical protein
VAAPGPSAATGKNRPSGRKGGAGSRQVVKNTDGERGRGENGLVWVVVEGCYKRCRLCPGTGEALCHRTPELPSRYVKVHALNYIQWDDTECKYTTNDSCTIPIPGVNYHVSTTSACSVCLFAPILASADRIILESCAAASAGLGETYPRRRRILTYVILFG